MSDWQECDCGRGKYDSDQYSSCYDCFIDRRADYIVCILCGRRWHSPDFGVCFTCRRRHPGREEAARELRLSILIRDDFTCRWCGEKGGDLQVDHIKPCAAGGTADPWNLQVLCSECNREKGPTWWTGCKWDSIRTQQLADYFIGLRNYLDPEQRQRLLDEVALWRRNNGYWSLVPGATDDRTRVKAI